MKEFTNALSNTVILNEDNEVEKIYSTDSFKKHFGNQEKKVLEKLNYKFKDLGNKVIIEYFDNISFDDSNITDEDIINVAKSLRELHSLSIDGLELSPFEKVYDDFLSEDDEVTNVYPIDGIEDQLVTEAIKILEEGKQVVLHNDVVEGNLLKINGKIKLIDFEYSGIGNELFDIASFITERELNENQKKLFISQFENVDEDKLKIVCKFLQIFWSRWALYKYSMNNRNIYKEIAEWKYNEYLKIK